MKNNKEKFIALCKQWIKRDGLQDLLNWLEETDFYEAPASTRFHSMFEGGLCSHSINVFNRMNMNVRMKVYLNIKPQMKHKG